MMGNLFQISNQTTLGRSERDSIESLERVTRQIMDAEERARDRMMRDARVQIEDKVWRAYGTLRHCRSVHAREVINLCSAVRLGVAARPAGSVPAARRQRAAGADPAGPPAALRRRRAHAVRTQRHPCPARARAAVRRRTRVGVQPLNQEKAAGSSRCSATGTPAADARNARQIHRASSQGHLSGARRGGAAPARLHRHRAPAARHHPRGRGHRGERAATTWASTSSASARRSRTWSAPPAAP